MGQRDVTDSDAMGQNLWEGVRVIPSCLEMASTLLGSKAVYEEFEIEMVKYGLRGTIDALAAEYLSKPLDFWTSSSYNYQLYSLRSLSQVPTGSVPDFMKASLWAREKLNTQLASWAGMRHDNILYPKAINSPVPGATPVETPTPTPRSLGFVEPYPEFFTRLEGLCSQTRSILSAAGVTIQDADKFNSLQQWATQFGTFAQKITDGTPLNDAEKTLIRQWGNSAYRYFDGFIKDDKPYCIADIYCYNVEGFPGNGGVLHEAAGMLHPIIILYKEPGYADYVAGLGYVTSFYELLYGNQITDHEWNTMLGTNPTPPSPAWTNGYIGYQ
jgi:hypothetical protein